MLSAPRPIQGARVCRMERLSSSQRSAIPSSNKFLGDRRSSASLPDLSPSHRPCLSSPATNCKGNAAAPQGTREQVPKETTREPRQARRARATHLMGNLSKSPQDRGTASSLRAMRDAHASAHPQVGSEAELTFVRLSSPGRGRPCGHRRTVLPREVSGDDFHHSMISF